MRSWKSSNGSIKFSEMTTTHLARAWSRILTQINNNKLLPLDLVIEAGLDRYEGDSLENISYYFSLEWQRRSAEAEHVARLEKEAADHAYTELKNIEARFNAGYNELLEKKVSPARMLSLFKAYGKA
jgi:hypothetical protein